MKEIQLQFCDAGRRLIKDSDPYWSTPCMAGARITLLIYEEDNSTVKRVFCLNHMDDLHRSGVV